MHGAGDGWGGWRVGKKRAIPCFRFDADGAVNNDVITFRPFALGTKVGSSRLRARFTSDRSKTAGTLSSSSIASRTWPP